MRLASDADLRAAAVLPADGDNHGEQSDPERLTQHA